MANPSFPPYNVGDLGKEVKRQAPAAARNVEPIGDVLAEWLPDSGVVLEIASGTGEHALAFARRFPQLDWRPTDPDPDALASIAAWAEEGPPNLKAPVQIDVCADQWPVDRADAMLCINMVHIAPWEASIGLLDGAAALLGPGAPLILYGPWRQADVPTAPSNQAFDVSLRDRDPRWGLRLVEDFAAEAEQRGLRLLERRPMPSNNLMLRFEKTP
ncbi:MAG: class I SAM-dependent methyltransferase [Pseudomonadota bacterium]|nr:class I SAM-dependent methyltransferase [Pseudomonadota bacterium]